LPTCVCTLYCIKVSVKRLYSGGEPSNASAQGPVRKWILRKAREKRKQEKTPSPPSA